MQAVGWMLVRIMALVLLSGYAQAQIRQLSDVRSICAEGILSKNFESNVVLSDVLSDYYESFERQFRDKAQSIAKVEFFYNGTAESPMAIWFPDGHAVNYDERRYTCDAEISSSGEVRALSPTIFRITIRLLVNGLLSEADSHLSQVEKSNRTATLWRFQSTSRVISPELEYTAYRAAVKAAVALASSKTIKPKRMKR
jgi:hypothetical protein